MTTENDKAREEKLLQAIGNLPEDMIAQAAEYKPSGRRKKQGTVVKILATAACLALVFLGGTKVLPLFGNHKESQKTTNIAAQNIDNPSQNEKTTGNTGGDSSETTKKGAIEDSDTTDDNVLASVKAKKMQLWAAGAMKAESESKSTKKGSTSSDSQSFDLDDSKDIPSSQTIMEEGETVSLKVTQTEDVEGEEISVITIGFAETEEHITYSLRSQSTNCQIVSVSHEDLTTIINLPYAECSGGDVVELDTRQTASMSLAYNIVPEWEDISIIDIINITGKKEGGEAQKLGRLVIGRQIKEKQSDRKGEKYYGIYQKQND